MAHPVILTDADNTLWDTDSVFAKAQLCLLASVEQAVAKSCLLQNRLDFVRHYDQAIAAGHHAHLKYPPGLLVWALALALDNIDAATAVSAVLRGHLPKQVLNQQDVDLIVQKYLAVLSSPPELLPTVKEGVLTLYQSGAPVYMITEGKIEKQRKIVEHYSLTEFITGIFEVAKNQAQFERLRQRFTPSDVIVIGDQPDRDIVPAKAAGCTTVLVPSRFRPQWHNTGHWGEADFVAQTFEEAVDWTLRRFLV